MKHLLERWATLEPHLCIFETTKNIVQGEPDLQEAYLADFQKRMRVIFDDTIGIPLSEDSLMRIQWAVQQAIIERGWYLEIYYTPSTFNEAIVIVPSRAKGKVYSQNNMAEALLAAYLEVLSANP